MGAETVPHVLAYIFELSAVLSVRELDRMSVRRDASGVRVFEQAESRFHGVEATAMALFRDARRARDSEKLLFFSSFTIFALPIASTLLTRSSIVALRS